jgi:drug/metabolite transporter (DMT)-like permease
VSAIALALAAAIAWGTGNFFGGLRSRSLGMLRVLAFSILAEVVFAAVVVAVHGKGPPEWRYVLWGALAGIGSCIGLGGLYRGLAVGAMGVVAPITATAPVVPVIVGVAHGERPAAVQWVGMAVALAGAVLISLEPGGRRAERGLLAAGAGVAVVSALGFGWGYVGLAAASRGGGDPYWAILVPRLVMVLLIGATVLAVGGIARPPANLLPLILLAGTLDILGTLLYTISTTKGLLSVVSVLSALYPVVVVLLAWLVLHERLARVQRSGAAFALLGAALVSVR